MSKSWGEWASRVERDLQPERKTITLANGSQLAVGPVPEEERVRGRDHSPPAVEPLIGVPCWGPSPLLNLYEAWCRWEILKGLLTRRGVRDGE